VWKEKKSEMHGHDILRAICGGSRNTFTVGNGHHPGVTPGTWEEPGNRYLVRMLGTGGSSAVPGKSQVTGRVWCGVAGQGPLRLIHGGDLVLFCAAPAFRPGQTRPQGPEFRSRRRYAGHGGGLSGAVAPHATAVCSPGEQAAATRFLTEFGFVAFCGRPRTQSEDSGRFRGSPKEPSTLVSNRMTSLIRSPARVRTMRPSVRPMPVAGSRT